jgi:hypothetical protein
MSSDDHLNSNRIQQMAALRRSAIRSRSYCVIAIGGCVVGAAEFIFDAVRQLHSEPKLHGILIAALYLIAAAALLGLGWHFVRIARRLHGEIKRSVLPEPTGAPDFSPLQDGSQFGKNLEEM